MNDATIVGGEWFAGRHRQLSINKVENGYRVKARYAKNAKPATPGFDICHEDREFVFEKLSELMAWVNAYLTADAEELKVL